MAELSKEHKIGDKMNDGTIYAGISPDTGNAIYTTPTDALLTYTFNQARAFAQDANSQNAFGHDDWRVPTKTELNVLFNNRAAIGRFNIVGSAPAGWYRSSSALDKWDVWCQRFSDGYQHHADNDEDTSVRLVRTEPPKAT